jgi:HYDIN/CFA65/VesB family protein
MEKAMMTKTTICGGFVAVGLLVGIIFGAQQASAQTFGFPVAGFTTSNVCQNSSTPPPSCQILTDGSPSQPTVVTGGILRLTTANINQHGAAWYYLTQPLSTGFTTAFQFQISSTNSCFFCSFPADGLALVIQNDPAGTGAIGYTGNGQNMSYGNNDVSTASGPGNAIKNSLAIELDTHLNSNYSDPDGNHIAVQSCGPNNASTLTPNSADHNYACPDGNLAKLALQSLPAGLSLTDGKTHTITVNYLPPGTCTSACNNLSVYMDSTLILQATVDITKQLNLTSSGGAYLGFTAATGASVENNDIISWSFSSLPLAPITINQPLQPTQTNFNYTTNLTALTDYSQSGLNGNSFQGVVMQGTAQSITDQQFSDLVNNTPFQGSTCQHQDTGSGNYNCVTTTDLCTTPTNGNASGANCPNTGTNALIIVNNSYNLDPSQKPVIAPGYIMGKDTALSCGASGDNTCKGLINIFTSISGDLLSSGGKTNNFNSILIPILGVVQPSTSPTTTPPLNQGWTNSSVALNFNSIETVPSNNHNPPSSLPTVSNITYSATGANLPNPASGTLPGSSGTITIPATVEGTTVVTFFATDSAGTVETTITNNSSTNTVSSATPSITIQVDKTPPTANCVGPNPPPNGWQAADVLYNCTASDSGSGLANSSQSSFTLSTNVPAATETASATIPLVTIFDVAGNSTTQGPFGPFEVDKKAPTISTPSLSASNPVFGQSVTATYTCADGGSGVVLCAPTQQSTQIPPTASVTITSPVDTSSVGSHTFTAYSQDQVGNASSNPLVYTVGQATPTIAWTAPAAITYGTALSGTQLNATASVPGTFAYSPAAGAVLGAGTQTLSVTFTPTDTTDYKTATASVSLIVNQATPTITWSTPSAITYGTALSGTQLNATANVAGTFVYSPVAGTVLGSGTQTLSTTFTPTDTTDYGTVTTSVLLVVNKATPTITWSTPSAITYGTALSGTQLNATANVPGTFVYSPAAGTVLGAGTQMLSTTFTPTDTTDYGTVTTSVLLVVNKATPTITWPTPSAITYGTALSATQLDATASVAGTFVYSPASGTVLGAGTQTLSTTFTPTDTTDYGTATTSVLLTVNKATPTITWSTPSAITYGTALSGTQLNATANVAGTFVYSPAAGTVLGAGTQTLSTTFTPTDTTDYGTATTSVLLVVNKATPTITWPTPAPISYGTALSSTQLDATANVPGTFVYTPPAGTILAAGNQTLSVTFTPTDSVDYTTASKQVTLVVTQPLISFSPTSLNFGTVKQKSVTSLTVVVSNPGTGSLTITSIALQGNDEDNDLFTITNKCTSAVAPGGNCSFTVTFSAQETGSMTQTLLVTDNVTGSPQQIPITLNVTRH